MVLEIAPIWTWYSESESMVVEMETGTNPFFWVGPETQGYVCHGSTRGKDYSPHPINIKDSWVPTRFARSYHPKGIHAAMCDGSVAFVSDTMNFENYRGLFAIRGKSLATLP